MKHIFRQRSSACNIIIMMASFEGFENVLHTAKRNKLNGMSRNIQHLQFKTLTRKGQVISWPKRSSCRSLASIE